MSAVCAAADVYWGDKVNIMNITAHTARKLIEFSDGKLKSLLFEDVLDSIFPNYPFSLDYGNSLMANLDFEGKPLPVDPLYCTVPRLLLRSHGDIRMHIQCGGLSYVNPSSKCAIRAVVDNPELKKAVIGETWRDRAPLL